MLVSTVWICSAIGPGLLSPVSGSSGTIPDTKMRFPARTPGECGRLPRRELFSIGFFGSIVLRARAGAAAPSASATQSISTFMPEFSTTPLTLRAGGASGKNFA